MSLDDFKRIITAFADKEADVDLTHGTLLVQIRDELIEAHLYQESGDLIVEEAGERRHATAWLINRVARLPLLADRILSYVIQPEPFVIPSGRLLEQPNRGGTLKETEQLDAADATLDALTNRPAGTTSVLYLTSDAGEGKTTLISHLARKQAEQYKAKRSSWLLVPIPLGGRTFLRFDDVVVAALVNRLRFQLLYYDAFLELVRLGVLVPAFDGFEEMIVESSQGEAISALGNLVRSLHSNGAMLIAARKAYFEYSSFDTQARLFDVIHSDAVEFARLSLDRWNRSQFIDYCEQRAVSEPESLYSAVAVRLAAGHPLLTRAVLVRRLVDVARDTADLSSLLHGIGNQPQDYFFQFVNTIVEREAKEKWLDRSGEPAQPLISVADHHELLAMVAQEQWISSTDSLRVDTIGAIADMFAETKGWPPSIARQIRERIKQHSLLIVNPSLAASLMFDHEDFRVFYLGEALGRLLAQAKQADLRAFLQVGNLPRGAIDEAVLFLRRRAESHEKLIAELQQLASSELPTSFVQENCGALVISLLDGKDSPTDIASMTFPIGALRGRHLHNVTFSKCYFQPTSIAQVRLDQCRFHQCRFDRIEVEGEMQVDARFEKCMVASLLLVDSEEHLFDPNRIQSSLREIGFDTLEAASAPEEHVTSQHSEELRLLERVLRAFLRSTHVNEAVIRTKLGVNANRFLEDMLPALLKAGILQEVPYLGSGAQRRFKMGVPMHKIQEALRQCKGDYGKFLAVINARP